MGLTSLPLVSSYARGKWLRSSLTANGGLMSAWSRPSSKDQRRNVLAHGDPRNAPEAAGKQRVTLTTKLWQ
jgi:hypothetical protein